MERIKVTLVGAGHYGRGLVASKYRRHSSCRIESIVSPTVSKRALEQSGLSSVPLYRNAAEWIEARGKVTQEDLVELAVHYDILPSLLKEFVSLGARNFVLPKPVALDAENLRSIQKLQERYGLNCAVSSQWHYSAITRATKTLVQEMKKTGIQHVDFNFSQQMSEEQLQHYSPRTALVPHILQIVYSTGLSGLKNVEIAIRKASPAYLDFSMMEGGTVTSIISDLGAQEIKRTVEIDTATQVDFLAVFDHERAVKHPAVITHGKRQEIKEDNLQVMVDRVIDAFLHHEDISKDAGILTLEKYLPIAEFQVNLEQEIQRRGAQRLTPRVKLSRQTSA